jgi:hypothetical protein
MKTARKRRELIQVQLMSLVRCWLVEVVVVDNVLQINTFANRNILHTTISQNAMQIDNRQ